MKRTGFYPSPDVIALLGLLAAVALVSGSWSSLPATIPVHFGAAGNVNGYGGRGFVFLPLGMAIAVLSLFFVVRRFPRLYNLRVPPGDIRRPAQEALASEMIAWLGAVLSWNFVYLLFAEIRSAQDHTNRLPLWTLPLALGATAIPIVFFLLRLRKQPR